MELIELIPMEPEKSLEQVDNIKQEDKRKFYEVSTKNKQGVLRQGEIISDLYSIALKRGQRSSKNALKIPYKYAIVVTQDCDLEQDYKARFTGEAGIHRLLTNILFCEVEDADVVRHGNKEDQNFPKDKQARSDEINSKKWGDIRENKDERFHYLTSVESPEDCLATGLPNLAIEFKRYFSIATEEVYYQLSKSTAKRRCVLSSPYMEHFSVRFHYYHYRIALPKNHY